MSVAATLSRERMGVVGRRGFLGRFTTIHHGKSRVGRCWFHFAIRFVVFPRVRRSRERRVSPNGCCGRATSLPSAPGRATRRARTLLPYPPLWRSPIGVTKRNDAWASLSHPRERARRELLQHEQANRESPAFHLPRAPTDTLVAPAKRSAALALGRNAPAVAELLAALERHGESLAARGALDLGLGGGVLLDERLALLAAAEGCHDDLLGVERGHSRAYPVRSCTRRTPWRACPCACSNSAGPAVAKSAHFIAYLGGARFKAGLGGTVTSGGEATRFESHPITRKPRAMLDLRRCAVLLVALSLLARAGAAAAAAAAIRGERELALNAINLVRVPYGRRLLRIRRP